MNETLTTYEPDNSLKKGYLYIFREIFNELRKNRWLTYQLFKRDFLTVYKQSFVGSFWALILPLISVCTFIILNRSGILRVGEIKAPYPIYAILGIVFWQLFSTGLLACSNALVSAGTMLTKINFSKKSLVIASMGRPFVSFLIQFVLVAFLFVYYRFIPSTTFFLLPLLLIPIILLTLGLGFILSLVNGVVRDIGNIIGVLLTFLMFLTPVLYAKPTVGILADVTKYNPLYYLISVPRDLILSGRATELEGFFVVSILSSFISIICLVVFHLTETRVTERI